MIFVFDIDLFVLRFNVKIDCFVLWYLEFGVMVVDVFSISWVNLKCYVFFFFSLLI